MIQRTYDETYSDAAADDGAGVRAPVTYVGEQIFIWIAWAAAFAFWAFAMQEFFGILEAITSTPASVVGHIDLGAMKFLLLSVVAFLGMTVALAYGLIRTSGRDRSRDPVSEAATARLYDEGARPRA